ncbi:MAG: hypothetical protein HY876_07480 [Coriobacteriales bacterium]|nr:hypothetical protein [Coriobacteriales bacterium]
MLTANIPASVFNVLVVAFFVVVLLGVVLGAYAATQLRKCQEELRRYKSASAPPMSAEAPEA